jgi:hypothetical protein
MSSHLRGHLLLFDRPSAPAHSANAGARLLVAAAFAEIVRLAAVNWVRPATPLWLLLPGLLGLALSLMPVFARVKFSQLGFRRWRDWTPTEKSYFVQVVFIANIVFPIVLAEQLRHRIAQPDLVWSLCTVFLPYLLFGFYQELVYRGMLQSELIRRW